MAADIRVVNTETGSLELLIDNDTDSSIYGMRILFSADKSRLILHRLGLAMGDRRFSMYDLNTPSVLTFPYLWECPDIAKAGNLTTITLLSPSATTCIGENAMRDDEIYFGDFSRSGRYIGFRPGIVDMDRRKIIRVDRAIWKEGSPDVPQIHLNVGEQEALGVWNYAGWIEGFDLSAMDSGPAFAFKPQWDNFRWFPESISPDGKIIVLQVYENFEAKLVAVENPFIRTWLKAKLSENGNADLSWTGGAAPYRVLASPSLETPLWTEIGVTNERAFQTPADLPNRFYRVESLSR
ncbi:MAG TPA: hypothetical protein VM680_08975 [Verrucomicrobiae bacterium]|nr:hypothetical protein [Verrucomicrobiae bacterium]